MSQTDISDPDIEEIITQLSHLRAQFGRVGDDYRQSRIDVAVSQLEQCQDVKEDYINAEMWSEAPERP